MAGEAPRDSLDRPEQEGPVPRVSGVVEDAVGERLKGGRPGRLRAFFAAAAIAVTVAVLAFRLLRSRSDDDGDD